MAKLKVKQIEDLLLTADTQGAVRTIQIGANTITPLTGVSATEGENSVVGGYISGLSVSGNEIVITRTALPELSIANNATGTFVLNAAVDPDNNHQINLAKGTFDVSTNAEGETPAHTGSLIFGDDKKLKVNDTWVKSFIGDGKLKVKFGTANATELFTANAATDATLELSAVASTGKAEDVSIADAGSIITATTVEGALQEIAAEIDAMDLIATDVVALNSDKNALQAGKIKEEDGKVSVETVATLVEFNQAVSSTNKVATMADVAKAAELDGENAIVVTAATTENPTVVSLKINPNDNVLTQDANGLLANLGLTYDSTNKKIQLLGKAITPEGGTAAPAVIAQINATDFIKDGMLADAEIITATNEEGLTPGKRYIKFTFKTYQYGVEGEEVLKVEYLDVESLIDSYTSGNEWIKIDQDTNKISHKTQGTFTPVEGQQSAPQTTFGANTANDYTADAAGESVEFKVPSFTVDAAGHVTAASEKTVKVELPAAQTITGETATSQGNYINVKVAATKGQNNDNYTLSTTSNVTTQAVATAKAADGETPAVDGLATALDVKTYVDDKIAGQSPTTITMTRIVRGTANANFVTFTDEELDGYTIVATSTVGFLNGQLVPSVSVAGNTVTYVAYSAVDFEEGDRFDVIATVTKDVEVIGYTAPTQNAQ